MLWYNRYSFCGQVFIFMPITNTPNLTEQFINELISCEKNIIASPMPKDKANGFHKQTDLQIESVNKQHSFTVFIREHIELMESFSIGLMYHRDKETDSIIIRYNGSHIHKNPLTNELIEGFHIHKLSMEAINAGLKGEIQAEITKEYSTLSEALIHFFQDLRIINFQKYFPELSQLPLFK